VDTPGLEIEIHRNVRKIWSERRFDFGGRLSKENRLRSEKVEGIACQKSICLSLYSCESIE
jgi:hypothetical protein